MFYILASVHHKIAVGQVLPPHCFWYVLRDLSYRIQNAVASFQLELERLTSREARHGTILFRRVRDRCPLATQLPRDTMFVGITSIKLSFCRLRLWNTLFECNSCIELHILPPSPNSWCYTNQFLSQILDFLASLYTFLFSQYTFIFFQYVSISPLLIRDTSVF